jgi:hypothetical protein
MISFSTYKWLHFVGVFLILFAFGSLIFRANTGAESNDFSKRWLSVAHGLGMLISVIGGFGMLSRLGIDGQDWPWWVTVKFMIWLVLGFMMTPVNRAGHRAKIWWWLIFLLAMVASYIGLNHPAV